MSPDIEEQVILLALKKNKLDIDETFMLLVDEEKVKNLQEELSRTEEKNTFIPIIADE